MEAAKDANTTSRLQWLALPVWLLVCFSAAALGAFFPPDEWYGSLTKPEFAPPDYLFGPVWTVLYLTMAIAAWLVWKQPPSTWRRTGLILFFVQLALNAAWSPLFFGMHRIDLALIDLELLWLLIWATIVVFYQTQLWAGLLLLPYAAWVTFALRLNYAYWVLNSAGP